MNEIKIFNNEEFGQVRMVVIDGKIYFVGKDIANALGYSNPRDAISRHCKGVVKHDSFKEGGQKVALLPEGDIYRLVIKSQLQTAEKFERWVFDEVLPTIRKTGGYINNSDLMINTYFSQASDEHKVLVKGLLENIENQQQKIIKLSDDNKKLETDNKQLDTDNKALSGKLLDWAFV